MENKLIGTVLTIVVGVVLLGSLLIVAINDYTDETRDYRNVGTLYEPYTEGDTHTITFTEDSVVTDGVAQNLPDTSAYGAATIIYGSGGMIRYMDTGYLSWWGTIGGSAANRSLGVATAVTITIADTGATTAVGASSTRSIGLATMYPDPDGAYALAYNPRVLEDSTMYGCGVTTVGDASYAVAWTGTIEEITASSIFPADQEFGTIAVNTSNPATNLLKIDSVVIPNTTAGADFTYTYFFAPKSVTYENPDNLGSSNSAILLSIPVIVIAGLLVITVRGFVGNRD